MDNTTREQIIISIEQLPADALPAVAQFLAHLQKAQAAQKNKPPYTPVSLGGLWAGVEINEDDIAEARHEVWGPLGKKAD